MAAENIGITVPGEIRIPYEWSAGVAGSRFLKELRDNKRIMGTKCSKCRRKLLEKPWILSLIHIEGCNSGLVHFIDEVDPDKIEIGMKVEAVFKEKRDCSILDIKYFRPVKESRS